MITIDNVLELAHTDPQALVTTLSGIIDNPKYDVPDEIITPTQIRASQKLQSYYANMYGYLNTLWGVVRVAAGKDSQLIAVRDVIEKAASVCKLKYAAASRGLTGFQTLQEEGAFGERAI